MVKCPECGLEVGVDTPHNASAHAIDHWSGLEDRILSKEGRERRNVLLEEAKKEK